MLGELIRKFGNRIRQQPALVPLFVLLVLPPVAYLTVAFSSLVDAPFLDDYPAILRFVVDFQEADTVEDRLGLIFEPHNEHQLVFTRAATLLAVGLQGRLDFRTLSVLGSLGLVSLAVPLFLCLPSEESLVGKLVLFLPVSLFVFQPQAFDIPHWPTVSVASHFVILFALLAFHLLRKDSPRRLFLAMVCAVFAFYTQGNGILVFPVALVLLLLNARWRTSLLWLVTLLPIVSLYFWKHTALSAAPGAPLLLEHWKDVVVYFSSFVGVAAEAVAPGTGTAATVLILLSVLTLVVRRHFRSDFTSCAGVLFMLLTVAGNTMTRFQLGALYPLGQPRYRSYSILLVVLCHLALSGTLVGSRRRWIYHAFVCVTALAFSIASFAVYAPSVRNESCLIGRGLAYWSLTGQRMMRFPVRGSYWTLRGGPEQSRAATLQYEDEARAARLLDRASRAGVYEPAASRIAPVLDRPVPPALPDSGTGSIGAIELLVRNREFAMVEGFAYADGASPERSAVLVVLDAPPLRRVFTSERIVRDDLAHRSGRSGLRQAGFRSIFPLSSIPAEDAKLGIFVGDGERASFNETGLVLPEAAGSPK